MTSSNVKITILVDNQAGPDCMAEHGLSLWIEAQHKHIIFDTGQGTVLEHNARVLGIDFGKTDVLVLSHGHYDHTGGIQHVLQQGRKIHVYCHPGIVQPRYSIRNGVAKPIQIPRECMTAIDKWPVKHFHWIQQPTMLSNTIGITGLIPRETTFEDTGGPFYLDTGGRRADLISDDLALWIRTDAGVIVCVGCSHAGLVNTLNRVRQLNSDLKIRAVIGGFHLLEAGRQRLEQTIAALGELAPEIVVPCHCTGDYAVAALRDSLGDRVLPGAAGTVYRV